MINSDIMSKAEMAIDNGWTLRPCGPSGFVNIDYAKKVKLSDESHILDDIDDLNKFPTDYTCLALVAMHLKYINFVSLDFDFTDDALKEKIWKLFEKYNKQDLFQRIGNPDKLGQFWFQTEHKVDHTSVKLFDVIVHEKRCNAVGLYKDDSNIEYQYPYKNPWENLPDELPYISQALIDECLKVVSNHFGKDFTKKEDNGSRHDAVKKMVFDKMNRPAFLNIIQDVISTPEYIAASNERDFKKEVSRILEWSISTTFENFNDVSGFMNDEDEDIFAGYNIKTFPKVEKNSFIHVIYRAIKRNQFAHNNKLAFFSALSLSSWLLSFSVRFQGLAPNLMILYIAHSGAGKSTTSRAVKELIKLYREFKPSYMGNDIKTEASLLNNLEDAPNPLYTIDEFTKLYRSRNSKNSQVGNVTELLCQLYSDYSDTDLHQVRLKTHSYGVCLGPKMNMLAYSTPEFWKFMSESDFAQGIGRRMIFINDDSVSFAKKDMSYSKDFYKPNELKIMKMFIDQYVNPMFIYDVENVRGYNIKKGIDKKGDDVFWEDAVKPNPLFDLQPSAEVDEYFKNKFVDKCNSLKRKSMSSGNNLNLYVVNSMPEFVKKLAMIHAVAGKAIIDKKKNGELGLMMRTIVEMDSVRWAEEMFLFYMVNGLSVDLENIFNKDEESHLIVEIGNEFIERLEEKDITEFTRSSPVFKNFFRRKKEKGADRDSVINNLIYRDKLELTSSNQSKRGTKYRVKESSER